MTSARRRPCGIRRPWRNFRRGSGFVARYHKMADALIKAAEIRWRRRYCANIRRGSRPGRCGLGAHSGPGVTRAACPRVARLPSCPRLTALPELIRARRSRRRSLAASAARQPIPPSPSCRPPTKLRAVSAVSGGGRSTARARRRGAGPRCARHATRVNRAKHSDSDSARDRSPRAHVSPRQIRRACHRATGMAPS